MSECLNDALKFASDTKRIELGYQNLNRVGKLFQAEFPDRSAIIIADPVTFDVAGKYVQNILRSEENLRCEEPFIFPSAEIHAEMKHVESLRIVLANTNAVPIAIGSGTVNDLVKYTSSLCSRRYMAVPTAASMDGYASFGASIVSNECKQTFDCPAPAIILADMTIVCNAPQDMTASGYADLIAKIPAAADWLLADLIGTEPIDSVAWNMVQTPLRSWLNHPERIANGRPKAIENLLEGLFMSGLAMQKAKSSRTASGAEHQFSHLWDNERHTYRGKTPSHGFKVGIGTISTCALYEKMLTLTRADFDKAIATLPQRLSDWPSLEKMIRDSFHNPGLIETATKQCRLKFVEPEETRRRLELFRDSWSDFRLRLQNQLLPAATVQQMIRTAGAPATPEEIGIDQSRLAESFRKARLIRCRYNVLDWATDLGVPF